MTLVTAVVKSKTTVVATTNSVQVGGDVRVVNSNGSFDNTYEPDDSPVTLPNITKTDSDGTTSSIPSNEDVTCTLSPTIPTLTIGVFSDAGLTTPITSADYGDTIYIGLTTSITTPTEYRFNVFGRAWVTTVQAGASLSYTIDTLNDLIIYAEAKDATTVAASIPSKSIAVVNTLAAAFISRSNTLASDTMATYQQGVVGTAYKIANGIGAPNGSDLIAKFAAGNGVLFPYIPTSDSVASAGAYSVEFFDPTKLIIFEGFASGDFLPSGLSGGNGKYARLGVAPDDFGQNDISFGCSSLSGGSYIGNGFAMGVQDDITNLCGIVKNFNDSTLTGRYFVNDRSDIRGLPGQELTGTVISLTRKASYGFDVYSNGVIYTGGKFASDSISQAPSDNEFYGHSLNNNGTNLGFDSDPFGGFFVVDGLNELEMEDLGFLLNYIKDNIITGGR